MFAVLEENGEFSGVVYPEMTDVINEHHTKYGQSLINVDANPVEKEDGSYGLPTADQLAKGGNWKHRAYLDITDYYAVRFAETGKAMPDGVQIKRQAARDAIVD